MTQYTHLPYRPGVGIMLVNADQKIFVGKRIDTRSEAWQMPQGGIDEGEDAHNAAMRELEEETGITSAQILYESQDWYNYDLPDTLIPQLWGGKYRGQKQKWYLMRFDGSDDEINIHTSHPEFCQWKWVGLETLPRCIVAFKQELYAALVDEFKPHLAIQ